MKEKKSGQLLCKLKSKKRSQYHFNTDLDSEVKPKINSGGKDQGRHGSSQRMTKPIRLQDLENSVACSQTEKKKTFIQQVKTIQQVKKIPLGHNHVNGIK